MKTLHIIIIALILGITGGGLAFADRAELVKDARGTKVSGFAPNGGESQLLTINSATVDMTNEIAWSIYSPTACKFRPMSTGTKRGLTKTIPQNTLLTYNVHPKSVYINFSGCTNGELSRQ